VLAHARLIRLMTEDEIRAASRRQRNRFWVWVLAFMALIAIPLYPFRLWLGGWMVHFIKTLFVAAVRTPSAAAWIAPAIIPRAA